MNKNFVLHYPGGSLPLHRCRVMGVLNITPDSFSDGGMFTLLDDAITRAWEIVDEGGDILDVGAESSRPGAEPVSEQEEIKRLSPLLEALSKEHYPLPISLDTYKPSVLSHFTKKGWVQIANDITGLRNRDMFEIATSYNIPIIAMHMFGTPQTMQEDYTYENVVDDLCTFFQQTLETYDFAKNIIIDPGIGFGKSVAHNLEIIDRLNDFHVLNAPILVGASRKSFIGKSLNLEVNERLEPSLAVAALAVDRGCHILRAHDVKETRKVVQMVEKIHSIRTPLE
ncbi:MAG: dihydropteroate synthase [Bdellovibrionales bacterium]|nr:dihydropteroate synthase [Bdellovibrionales bacterium]